MENYIHIGKIVATHGINGVLIIKHVLGRKTEMKTVRALFVENVKGSYVPYFIISAKPKSMDEIHLQLEGIHNKESAKALIQKPVWLSEPDFRKVASQSAPISLLGFSIIANGENIGVVEEIIEQPHQVLLRTTHKGNETLIPLHKGNTEKTDFNQKSVHLTIPDGLLELYSG